MRRTSLVKTKNNISTDDYQHLFESSPSSFLILLPDTDFTIVAVTDDYLNDTLTKRENILGKPVFEVFPDNPSEPESHSTKLLADSFKRAIATKSVDTMATLRYDVPRPDGNGFEERYWRPVNKVALSTNGEILYIIHRAQDVTDYVQLLAENKANQIEREDLTAQKIIMEKEVKYRSLELEAKNIELTKANDALKQSTDMLYEQGQKKDEFLAMLAHELRNPLSPISAAADILSFKKLSDEKIKRCSNIISRQVKHMTSLIDDLLDVSRVKKGLISLKLDKINLSEIIAQSLEQVKPLIESFNHQLFLKTPMQTIFVMGDQHRLIQIFTNIIGNSAKYTPEGGSINLTLETEGELAKIVVTDNGVGMDAELIKQAFELFTQASRTSDRSQGGLGIGLALVKSLVELHQGSVTISSQGIGKGCQLTVLLPLLALNIGNEPSVTVDDHLTKVPTNGAIKVMVVDDSAANAEMVASLLEMTGYKVIVECDSIKALARSIIELPSIYILDIGLPNMDGMELARRLKTQPETQNATLIALSGYSKEQEINSAKEAGFDHYVVKPFEFKTFLAILSSSKIV